MLSVIVWMMQIMMMMTVVQVVVVVTVWPLTSETLLILCVMTHPRFSYTEFLRGNPETDKQGNKPPPSITPLHPVNLTHRNDLGGRTESKSKTKQDSLCLCSDREEMMMSLRRWRRVSSCSLTNFCLFSSDCFQMLLSCWRLKKVSLLAENCFSQTHFSGLKTITV